MATIRGGRFADEIHGTEFADWIRGFGGSDTLFGHQSDDLIDGGRDGDLLFGNLGNDTIYGRAGGDEIYGGVGNDTIWAGDDDDYADGGAGDDFIAGGKGNDFLSGGDGWNDVRGGVGDDLVTGSGQVAGGPGNDTIGMSGGIYYGDDVLGHSRGDDTFNFGARGVAEFQPINSIAIGGKGADFFNIQFCNDGIENRVDVLDFREDEGDRFSLMALAPIGETGGEFDARVFDTNGDRLIDGRDPWSEYGITWADPNANAVCLRTADGDLLALWGTQSVHLDFF